MKNFLLTIIFLMSCLVGISQTKTDTQLLKNQTTIISNQKTILKNQDTIKELTVEDTLKMSATERKKLEYFQYQRKQQQMTKNLEKMDKTIDDLDKQSAVMDSILLKKKKIK